MVALSRPKSPMLPPRLPAAGRRRQLPTFFFSVFERSTPLLPITSLQPQQFHAITHSFAQRRAAIPPIFNGFRTLSITTGVYLEVGSQPQTFRPSSEPTLLFASAWSLFVVSLYSFLRSFPLFSIVCSLFSGNTPGGGVA